MVDGYLAHGMCLLPCTNYSSFVTISNICRCERSLHRVHWRYMLQLAHLPRYWEAQRVLLDALAEDDISRQLEMDQDPDIARWFGWLPSDTTMEKCRLYQQHTEDWWQHNKTAVWAIRTQPQSPLAGIIEVRTVHERTVPRVELSWGLHPACRGRGLATMAVQALIDWCEQTQTIDAVYATVRADNLPSLSLVHRCRFLPSALPVEDGSSHWVKAVYAHAPTY